MSSATARLPELDFFRGLVLLVIVVDHIGGSILARFTLHTYALCDAAEVFVFLGGFATATAWTAIAARRSAAAARQRFVRRAFEIWRAFVVTALLMLLVSAVMDALGIDAPNLVADDLAELLDAPAAALRDIALLRRQPYLAGVLPMYACFALAVPLVVPLARQRPYWLLAGSVALWAVAPAVAPGLPQLENAPWDFNPAAWQLLFVLGVLTQTQPVYQRVCTHRLGWIATALACVVAMLAAWYRLHPEPALLDGSMKRHLAWFRVLNFAGLAWLVAHTVRHGWARRIALALPWVGLVGRHGLLCFVSGAVISLTVDSLLYWYTDGYLHVPLGLAADAAAVGGLLLVARAAVSFAARRREAARIKPA